MAKAKAKKLVDIENELIKHSDLISDKNVKQYISKKKEEKTKKDLEKWQANNKMSINKDIEMESESEEEEKQVEVIKPKKAKAEAKTKAIKKK